MWTQRFEISQVDRVHLHSRRIEVNGLEKDIICDLAATTSELQKLIFEMEVIRSFGFHQQLAVKLNVAEHLKENVVFFARKVAEQATANVASVLLTRTNIAFKNKEATSLYGENYNKESLTLEGSYIFDYIYKKAKELVNNEAQSLAEDLCFSIIYELTNKYRDLNLEFSLKELKEFLEIKTQQEASSLVKKSVNRQIKVTALKFCGQIENKYATLLSLELLFRLKQEEPTAAGQLPIVLKNGVRRAIRGESANYDLSAVPITISIHNVTREYILSRLKKELPEKLPEICAKIVGVVIDRAITTRQPFVSSVKLKASQLLKSIGLKSSRREREILTTASILCSNIYLRINPSSVKKSKVPISPIRLMDIEAIYNRKSKTDEFHFKFGGWFQYCEKDDIGIVTAPKQQKYHKTRDKVLQIVLTYSERNIGETTTIGNLLIEAYGVADFQHQLGDRKKKSRMLKKFDRAIDELTKLGVTIAITELGEDRLNHEVCFGSNPRLSNIKDIRQRLGKSQSELAQELCMTRNRLSQIEKGQGSLDLDRLATIARLLSDRKNQNQNIDKYLPP